MTTQQVHLRNRVTTQQVHLHRGTLLIRCGSLINVLRVRQVQLGVGLVAPQHPDEADGPASQEDQEDDPFAYDDVADSLPFHDTYTKDMPLCRAVQAYVYPKRAQNIHDKYRFIINSPDKRYIQEVRVRQMSLRKRRDFVLTHVLRHPD